MSSPRSSPGPPLPEPAARDWGFPRAAGGVALLVEHGTARGVPAAEVLRGTGLAEHDLTGPDREVTAGQELQAVRNLQRHLGADAGAEVGAAYHLSSFGIFGYALLASRTVLDAMRLALCYIDLSHAFAIPSAGLDPSGAVRIDFDAAGLPGDVRRFVLERDVAAVRTVLGELLPDGVPTRRVEPAGDGAGGDARAAVLVDADHLDRPLPQADPRTLALCESLCDDVVSRRRRRTGLAQQVRVLITQQLTTGAPMREVARSLGLSERTLRRRLALDGTSYAVLLDEVRESLARELLADGAGGRGLGVDSVAQRLGYAEAASLIHAFKRWTGTTPAAWRRDASTSAGALR